MVARRLKSLFGSKEEADNWEDRRADPRSKVLLKGNAYPVSGYAELVVRNVSQTGIAGETSAELKVGDPLLFSIEGNKFHRGTVRWVRGRQFGLDMVDARAVLGFEDEVDKGFLPSHQPRAQRQGVEIEGRVALFSRAVRVTVRDVSQSGLCLDGPLVLPDMQQVIVELRDRPLILASVQWAGGGKIGVKTAERIQTLRLVYAYE